jgi:hypothetical protein
MLGIMAMLFLILRSSFLVWLRSFALIYVFFLFMLIASFVLGPSVTPTMRLDTRTFALWGMLLLLFSAFMAGFYYMISQACQRYLFAHEASRPEALPNRKHEAVTGAFGLFRDFLPGIGQFFLPITIGYVIQFGVLGALAWNLNPLWVKVMPLLIRMETLVNAGRTPEQVVSWLSLTQQTELAELIVGILLVILVYGVFSLLTLLWPVFIVLYEKNPLKAYGLSLKHFFKDPVRLMLLSVFFLAAKLLFSFFTLSAGMFVDILGRLALLLLEIYMTITLFVYAWLVIGKPVLKPEPIEPAENQSIQD